MIWQQWHHYFYSVRGNCKLFFQTVNSPGVDGLFTTLRIKKNIWLLFDVDKLPGAPETELVSLALSLLFLKATNSHRISSEGWVEGTGYKLLLLHVREWMLGVLLDRQRRREEEEWEWECTPPTPSSLQVLAASCLRASKTIRPFFLPFTPLKKSDCGTRHNI